MRIAVCDDEKYFRDIIVDYLQPYQQKKPEIIISEFCCGENLVNAYLQGEEFDLIFLDIELNGLSGVEAGQKIRSIDNQVMFVFVSGYPEYFSDAFSLGAMQFLEKPVIQESFNKEFERAMCVYTKKRHKYRIVFKNAVNYLEIKDIIYIETYGRHLRAVTATNVYEFIGNITTEEKKLSEYGFVQCHKGYLLNMHHIFRLEKDMFILADKRKVPISRYLKNEAISKFNRFVSAYCV